MKKIARSVSTANLEIAYEQTGPDTGTPILLLHGFPYSPRQFDEVVKLIANEGRRIVVPYSRGFLPTRYKSKDVMHSGQQAATAKDVTDLMDALSIPQAYLIGFDWGARAACIVAALWPERVKALASVNGYMIDNVPKNAKTPEEPGMEHRFWYQWYFHTERGRLGLAKNTKDLTKLLWKLWSPNWRFMDKELSATVESFKNKEFVDTVIHSYRVRYANAVGDPQYAEIEKALESEPKIKVPTITIQGKEDGVEPPKRMDPKLKKFVGKHKHISLSRIGHCPFAEDPRKMAEVIEMMLTKF